MTNKKNAAKAATKAKEPKKNQTTNFEGVVEDLRSAGYEINSKSMETQLINIVQAGGTVNANEVCAILGVDENENKADVAAICSNYCEMEVNK